MSTEERDMKQGPVRVLFVCLGNICRSPLAEGVFRSQAKERGLEDLFHIDSAGTGAWHVGQAPDSRMRQIAMKHRVDLSGQRARQFKERDLVDFDYIFAMDDSNLRDILVHDREDQHQEGVVLFRKYDPDPDDYQVPDPYYGGDGGFDRVYSIVERTAQALIDHLSSVHNPDSNAPSQQ
jgi:protein-tyrosine phosphatase